MQFLFNWNIPGRLFYTAAAAAAATVEERGLFFVYSLYSIHSHLFPLLTFILLKFSFSLGLPTNFTTTSYYVPVFTVYLVSVHSMQRSCITHTHTYTCSRIDIFLHIVRCDRRLPALFFHVHINFTASLSAHFTGFTWAYSPFVKMCCGRCVCVCVRYVIWFWCAMFPLFYGLRAIWFEITLICCMIAYCFMDLK